MSESDSPKNLYPDCNEDLTSMLQDLNKCQGEIKGILEESRDKEADREKSDKGFQEEIQQKLTVIAVQISQINSTRESPKKSGSLLTLVFPCLILILALSGGIYSFSQLVQLNKLWHLKIEQKVDELSTLNQIIQSLKDLQKEE